MVVGGSRQETLDPGFGLLDTRQQGVLVILKELVLPDGPDPVSPSFTETLDPGFLLLDTRQQGVLVILKELVLPGGFDLVSPSFTVRDVTSELSGPRSTSYRSET
ncbi:unnamed protein product [Schistosoma curassoni]|uniref:Uncharacterized protein n=1 Tax=Schistosoma curassoni TaxID=6186 RepID=A0A183L4N5_9TREM|nr:unnamed protein product [Schistosoma curassoni]